MDLFYRHISGTVRSSENKHCRRSPEGRLKVAGDVSQGDDGGSRALGDCILYVHGRVTHVVHTHRAGDEAGVKVVPVVGVPLTRPYRCRRGVTETQQSHKVAHSFLTDNPTRGSAYLIISACDVFRNTITMF